jgi:hypothetical protein
MQIIQFADVIQLMSKTDHTGKPVPFALKVVTYDRNRKKGGKILVIDKAIVERQSDKNKQTPGKNSPRHYENSTKNIMLIPSMQIRRIHPRLIIEFNNKQMIY